jgi:hypothetical protein
MNSEEQAPSSDGLMTSLSVKWQYVMDRLSPKVTLRWGIFFVFLFLYLVRVYFAEGWYIVSYGYGIYLLNQLIGFLSPQVSGCMLICHCMAPSNISLLFPLSSTPKSRMMT